MANMLPDRSDSTFTCRADKELVEAFKRIADGTYDEVPEQAFYNIGGIEDLERKWDQIKSELS